MKLKNALGLAISCVVLGSAVPAFAGTIDYTCAPGVASATCNYLNTTVAGMYSSTFTDASADVYVQYGATGLASTDSYSNDASYSSYIGALEANPDKDALQVAALAALNSFDSSQYGSGNVKLSAALESALGLGTPTGITASGDACFTIGSAGCYDAVVTVTNDPSTPLYYDNLGGTEASDAYDFYATVEHETDEVLGTSSCISTGSGSLTDGCDSFGTGTPSAVDLFRYSAPGSLVLDSSLSTTPGAYFSYDGGVTNGATGVGGSPKYYNTLANGDDYADFVSSDPDCGTNQAVQDAEGCPGEDAGLSILNDGGSEINILNAVGYDLASNVTPPPIPEPSSLVLLGTGILGFAGLVRRRLLAA
jgi:hypothetical protein